MSADEYRLGDKAHSERFAHSVTDFARKRQEIFELTAATAAERFNNASMTTVQYWTPTQNEKAGSRVNAAVPLVRPAPKP